MEVTVKSIIIELDKQRLFGPVRAVIMDELLTYDEIGDLTLIENKDYVIVRFECLDELGPAGEYITFHAYQNGRITYISPGYM